MAKAKIPMYPTNGHNLKPEEKACLSYYVISGCTREDAFRAFVRPDLSISPSVLSKYVTQFFGSKDVMDYISEYETVLEEFLHPQMKAKAIISEEERKAKRVQAAQDVIDWAVVNAGNIAHLDNPELLLKVMDKAGMFDSDEQVIEEPRRYLPEMCYRSCRYRAFCEQECEDECERCKYKEYAENNGVHYGPENQLK